MIDVRIDRTRGYKEYHCLMVGIGDCDPAYPALRYVAHRFELNTEQRYWLAWLYSLSYCAPTAFYMLNEFPDYENVDERRLERWWLNNKVRCLFQTDRAKVKNFNKIVPMFKSYRDLCGGSQEATYLEQLGNSPDISYDQTYAHFSKLYYFGRFSLFLLLEAVHELTGLPIEPTGLDLPNAESCRNGLCYALGADNLVDRTPTQDQYLILTDCLRTILSDLRRDYPGLKHTYWNVETSLCAFKKLFKEKRYLGYYIDRMQSEMTTMQESVNAGVDWSVLWDFRREYFPHEFLGELNGWNGIRPKRAKLVTKTGHIYEKQFPLKKLTREVFL